MKKGESEGETAKKAKEKEKDEETLSREQKPSPPHTLSRKRPRPLRMQIRVRNVYKRFARTNTRASASEAAPRGIQMRINIYKRATEREFPARVPRDVLKDAAQR